MRENCTSSLSGGRRSAPRSLSAPPPTRHRGNRVTPAEGRDLSSRQTQNVAKDMEIGKPINSNDVQKLPMASHAKDGVRSCPRAGCGVREESWNELASESLVRSKPSRRDGSESCGRRGDAGSEA